MRPCMRTLKGGAYTRGATDNLTSWRSVEQRDLPSDVTKRRGLITASHCGFIGIDNLWHEQLLHNEGK